MPDHFLPRTGIFSNMDDEMRQQVITYGSVLNTNPGQPLVTQGKPQKHFYVVLGGTFEVTTDGPLSPIKLETVSVGDCFGEINLFDPGLASANVVSAEYGMIWFTDAVMFQLFLFEHEIAGCALLLGINTLLSRRLKSSNQVVRNNQIIPSFLSIRNRKHLTAALPDMTRPEAAG